VRAVTLGIQSCSQVTSYPLGLTALWIIVLFILLLLLAIRLILRFRIVSRGRLAVTEGGLDKAQDSTPWRDDTRRDLTSRAA
jgi:hypothetical protein